MKPFRVILEGSRFGGLIGRVFWSGSLKFHAVEKKPEMESLINIEVFKSVLKSVKHVLK